LAIFWLRHRNKVPFQRAVRSLLYAMSSGVKKEENLAAELLKNAHPFELEAPLVQQLSLLLSVQHFKANDFVFHEGAPSDAVYIVGSGAVRLVMHAQHLVEFQPGQTVGELFLWLFSGSAFCLA